MWRKEISNTKKLLYTYIQLCELIPYVQNLTKNKKMVVHKKPFKFITIIMLAINGGFSGIMSTTMCTKYYKKKKNKYLYTEIYLPCVQNLTKKKNLVHKKIFKFVTVRVSQTINDN